MPVTVRLNELQLRINKLRELDIPVAYQNALIDNSETIREMIQEQLAEGITGLNIPITLDGSLEYHPKYVKFKRVYGLGAKGKEVSFINLYFSGLFNEMMYTIIRVSSFNDEAYIQVKSNVPYFNKLIRRAGPDIMVLTPESEEILMVYHINPIIEAVINEALHI